MRLMKTLAAAGLMMTALWTHAAPTAVPDTAQVKAAHDLLVAMQAEKMVRTTAGMSKYPSPAQRDLMMAKLDKLPNETVYTRLALPVARLLSTATAVEMTRYYQSSYGQKVLTQTYNGPPRLYPADPVPTAKEKAELKQPAFVKANQEFKAAEQAIHHEAFVLIGEINKGK
ncbi:hypothetical protein [Rugamonas rivuli]|uniref:DUF2059 domain-containing protein n=1 Tax=Rugamonas rivuli TaxID=2743358 RepID=A0A843SIF4_9BURK|nr:hypothetical protein [Rugamonas rivuli]MQA21943.1 hypothetical protein [Rugamonas rivuli]